MKKYARFLTLALAYILLPTYQTTVKAADDVLMTEKCKPEQRRFDFEFSTSEPTITPYEYHKIAIYRRLCYKNSATSLSDEMTLFFIKGCEKMKMGNDNFLNK